MQSMPNYEESKPFLAMQTFFKMLHILFCLDFGFFEHKSKTQRFFWKVATILNAIFLISLSFINIPYEISSLFWMTFFLSHYFYNVIVLISLSPNKTLCQLYRDLQIIDTTLRANCASFNLERKIIVFIMLRFVCSFITYTSNCFNRFDCLNLSFSFLSSLFIFFWLIMSINVVNICCTFVFYSIFCRLKIFSSVLKSNVQDTFSLQYIYKSIVDLTELHKSALEPLILSSVFYTTLEVMLTILFLMQEMKLENKITPREELLTLSISLICMFSLALCADYLSAQVEKTVLLLHEKLLQEKDSGRQRELERFIRYVEARPLRFRVYRVIPLDASLLGMVVNFAVTYLIVIIQFIYK